MMDDRVTRIDPKTGKTVQYLMPVETNARRIAVDDYGEKPASGSAPTPGGGDARRTAGLTFTLLTEKPLFRTEQGLFICPGLPPDLCAGSATSQRQNKVGGRFPFPVSDAVGLDRHIHCAAQNAPVACHRPIARIAAGHLHPFRINAFENPGMR